MKIIDSNYKELINIYPELYPKINNYKSPSLYFHLRALEELKNNFLSKSHLEMVYATLATWGMHRMGGKIKMVGYETFEKSILKHKSTFISYSSMSIENIINLDSIIKDLTKVCFDIEIMNSENTKIVGGSKTLAHILPNIVPPIDRRYTILFFTNERFDFYNKVGKLKSWGQFKDKEEEKEIFKYIIEKTYSFTNIVKKDVRIKIDKSINSSYPKIFDSLIREFILNKN